MAFKVNEFVIQAKIQEASTIQREVYGDMNTSMAPDVTDSVKREIIDECMERVKRLIEEKLDAKRIC
jgi:ATP-dependent Zn protease